MEIMFTDPYYDSETPDKDYTPELIALLKPFDKEVSVFETDVGHGADCPAFLVQIFASVDWPTFLTASGAGATFLLGKKINENIDAWIEIAEKVKSIIKKFIPYRVDENAATLLVLSDLKEKQLITNNISISVQQIQYSPVPSGKYKLDKHPDALYIITINTGNNAHIYGVKSNAEIVFNHNYGLSWHEF